MDFHFVVAQHMSEYFLFCQCCQYGQIHWSTKPQHFVSLLNSAKRRRTLIISPPSLYAYMHVLHCNFIIQLYSICICFSLSLMKSFYYLILKGLCYVCVYVQVVVMRVAIHCEGCAGKVKKHLSKMEGTLHIYIYIF